MQLSKFGFWSANYAFFDPSSREDYETEMDFFKAAYDAALSDELLMAWQEGGVRDRELLFTIESMIGSVEIRRCVCDLQKRLPWPEKPAILYVFSDEKMNQPEFLPSLDALLSAYGYHLSKRGRKPKAKWTVNILDDANPVVGFELVSAS